MCIRMSVTVVVIWRPKDCRLSSAFVCESLGVMPKNLNPLFSEFQNSFTYEQHSATYGTYQILHPFLDVICQIIELES